MSKDPEEDLQPIERSVVGPGWENIVWSNSYGSKSKYVARTFKKAIQWDATTLCPGQRTEEEE